MWGSEPCGACPRCICRRLEKRVYIPLPDQEQLLRFDAFESVMWTLRKRLRKDITWPADWDEGCRAVSRYFASPPKGAPQNWKPWGLREYDPPPAVAQA